MVFCRARNVRDFWSKLSAGIKPFAWRAVSGAMLWWIVLAFGLGWMSSGTVPKQATRLSDDAVVAALALVCAEKFMAHPNAAVKKAASPKLRRGTDGTYLRSNGLRYLATSHQI
jgi:hypothetical protein